MILQASRMQKICYEQSDLQSHWLWFYDHFLQSTASTTCMGYQKKKACFLKNL